MKNSKYFRTKVYAHSREFISSLDVHKYSLKYNNLDLRYILKNLDKIEKEILDDILKICFSVIEKNGFEIRGDLILIENNPFKILFNFSKEIRRLDIIFYSVKPTRSKNNSELIPINGIGYVKEFKIIYPKKISNIINPLRYIIFQVLNVAYKSIEEVFRNKFKHFSQFLFEGLYNIVYVELERLNKKNLASKITFSVTLRNNNKFRYFFDLEKLEILIDYFKVNQINVYSPIELLSALLSDEAGHTINMLKDPEENDFASLPSGDFVSMEDDFLFWSSEALFLDYKDISCYVITKTQRLIFEISCPLENQKELKEVFENCSPFLDKLFRENIKEYMKYAKDLSKLSKPKIDQNKYNAVAEFIGTFFGATTGQFVKTILEP